MLQHMLEQTIAQVAVPFFFFLFLLISTQNREHSTLFYAPVYSPRSKAKGSCKED